jgi:Rod binding domain-containing protein
MVERGSGEQMFAGMMDAHLASEAPERWHSGLGEALYRQLRTALPDEKQQAASLTKQQAPMPPMEKTR